MPFTIFAHGVQKVNTDKHLHTDVNTLFSWAADMNEIKPLFSANIRKVFNA